MHPEGFHGASRKGRFFEGWYHKLVTAEGRCLALIPGWFQGEDGQAFAFLMVFDGARERVRMARFPAHRFVAARHAHDVGLDRSRFTLDRLQLDVDTAELSLHGEVRTHDPFPWPVTPTSPGVMGWYGWVPGMQCWHGVLSLDHALSGHLDLDGERITLDGGRGYIEKDWGRSFPDAWVWMQANDAGTSLTASVATIPWALGRHFAGFIVGFLHDGELHRFTTYARGRIEKLEVDDDVVRWVLVNPTHRLTLVAQRNGATVLLPAPDRLDMVPKVPESLGVTLEARLQTLAGTEVVALTSTTGALEVMGDVVHLRRMLALC